MAYSNITDDFRIKVYSGTSMYKPSLKIDNVEVPYTQIKNIKISNPIIDTTSKTFYVGSFISQQITITFKNLNGLNVKSGSEVTLSIGQFVGEDYEWCPIGKYLVDDLSQNYYEKCELTCIDYAIKCKNAVNYKDYMTNNKITIDEILEAVCELCDIELDPNYPKTNGTLETGFIDSTMSGKAYISYIAEIKGCNAKMGRDGKLYLLPIKRNPSVTINALRSKTWELGEKYKITHVTYQDGVPTNWTFPEDETVVEENRLMLRQDNPFITNKEVVENVFNVVQGLELYSLKNENYGDVSLDSWDIISFEIGDKTYNALNHSDLIYEQTIMTKIEPKIPSKQQEVLVNHIKEPDDVFKRSVKATINDIEGTIETTIENTNNLNKNMTNILTTVDGQTIQIQKNTNDITTINNSINGMTINLSKSGNNLVRNTMFYDFSGWNDGSKPNVYEGNTPPTDTNVYPLWYCTETTGSYEKNSLYEWKSETSTWELSQYRYSELQTSLQPNDSLQILSNIDTRSKYISQRALQMVRNDETLNNSKVLYSQPFELATTQENITLSFNATTTINNSSFIVSLFMFDSTEDFYYKKGINSENIIIKKNDNKLYTLSLNIPRQENYIIVNLSTNAPTNTNLLWLKQVDTVYKLYAYVDSEWKEVVRKGILQDQNNNHYTYNYTKTYDNSEEQEACIYTKYNEDSDVISRKAILQLQTNLNNESDINAYCNVEIADIKVEYGDYSEWCPRIDEVYSQDHILDETGYRINKGDDTLSLQIDNISQYYKDTRTFYIDKENGYFRNAISETSNIDGLLTRTMIVDNKKIYGRYIK